MREGIASLIDPSRIRWIGFSHFESDECGALNSWLAIAPHAEPVCGLAGAMVTVNDFADRPAHAMTKTDVLPTGKYRFRFQHTPHLPHGWDAGMLFEETGRTLSCSDLFLQTGEREPLTRDDVVGRARQALIAFEASPFAGATPYTGHTGLLLNKRAELKPSLLVTQSAPAGNQRSDAARSQMRRASSTEDTPGSMASPRCGSRVSRNSRSPSVTSPQTSSGFDARIVS